MYNLLFLLLIPLSWVLPAQAATPREVKDVAGELVCLCGDCNRESLATCICSFATSHRQELATALDAGKTRQEIIEQFVDQYGQIILASPPPEGYNLLAWIAPFAILLFGIVVVRSVLVSWRRNQGATRDGEESTGPVKSKTTDYRERLQRELDHFDDS